VLLKLGSDSGPVTESLTQLGVPLGSLDTGFTSIEERLVALAKVWPTLTDTEKAY
jgi:hypothetical protein